MHQTKIILLPLSLLLLLSATGSHADLLDCEEKVPAVLKELGKDAGSALADAVGVDAGTSSAEADVSGFFKSIGCKIKEGVSNAGKHAKKLGDEIKEGAKKLGEKAKDLGSDIKERFEDLRDKLSKDSVEEMSKDRGFLADVEIINPDILKGGQQCGHGHILDALGNCSKLRK